ncbi:SGNH/GDSL hydrolase family protein [uncultured Thalassospira sp.]|jgi:lysophospholipase L1-like esterase|uniref:SGNH/GDSL hydrolase family protein n=1 Tax=uncultured Thalassospira sp. TaxID=404382 RepID=UPI0030D880EF|tara:strand:- start:9266 stop:9919 length:654 start_codon:yes stop_codon:yes gene_type:complete
MYTKTILAFGDSLTWGHHPEHGRRHPYDDLWPSVLDAGLGVQGRVISEGLGGRTTAFDDDTAPTNRNGVKILPTLLGSHDPLDLVIIMLGTNDLKPFICGDVLGATAGMRRLVDIVRGYSYSSGLAPAVLIMSPPHCCKTTKTGGTLSSAGCIAESQKLATAYRSLAIEKNCFFFDAASVAVASPVDGVHLDAANTRAIGTALIPVVEEILRGGPHD